MSIPFEQDANREFFFGKAHDIVVKYTSGLHMKTTAQLELVDQITRELCAAWQAGYDANGYTGCDDDECDDCLADDQPMFEEVVDDDADDLLKKGDVVHLRHDTWEGSGEYRITSVRTNDHAKITVYTVVNIVFDDDPFEVVHGDPEWFVAKVGK